MSKRKKYAGGGLYIDLNIRNAMGEPFFKERGAALNAEIIKTIIRLWRYKK